jgi:hypothetical protein
MIMIMMEIKVRVSLNWTSAQGSGSVSRPHGVKRTSDDAVWYFGARSRAKDEKPVVTIE